MVDGSEHYYYARRLLQFVVEVTVAELGIAKILRVWQH